MEEIKKVDHPEGCRCPGCSGYGWGHYARFAVLRWLLGLLVLALVFAMGVKVGEFKSELRSIYGNGMMRSGMMWQGDDSEYYPMMRNPGFMFPQGIPQQIQPAPATTTPGRGK